MKSYSQLMQERISVAVGTTARDVMIGVLESLKSDRDNFCRAVPAELMWMDLNSIGKQEVSDQFVGILGIDQVFENTQWILN
jgi:hypothetical protein